MMLLNGHYVKQFLKDAVGESRLRPAGATWRTRRNILVVSDSAHSLNYVKYHVWRVMRADRQTDKQTYKHAYHSTSHPYQGQSKNR